MIRTAKEPVRAFGTFGAQSAVAAPNAVGGIRRGVVEETCRADGRVRVRVGPHGTTDTVLAEIATGGAAPRRTGDRVLLAFDDSGDAFVIGVVGSAPETQEPGAETQEPGAEAAQRGRMEGEDRRMTLSDGVSVRISGRGGRERLALLSERDELLLEYHPRRGTLRLNLPAGDLQLTSPEGDIVLNAAGSVRLAGRSVEAHGRSHVDLGAGDPARPGEGSLRLHASGARLAGATLAVTSKLASLNVEKTRYAGRELLARVGSARIVAGRLERIADQVHERANRVYRTVRGLLQVRAERIRTLVDSTLDTRARKVLLKAEDDVKVKGERIHLG